MINIHTEYNLPPGVHNFILAYALLEFYSSGMNLREIITYKENPKAEHNDIKHRAIHTIKGQK